jgi:hypothetical protein
VEIASSKFSPIPIIDENSIEAAKKSFERLRPLCENDVEEKVFRQLLKVVNALEDSSFEGISLPSQSLSSHKPQLTDIGRIFKLFRPLHWLS